MKVIESLTAEQIAKIAITLNRTKTASELSLELKVSKSRIVQVANYLRTEHNVDIPKKRITLNYDSALMIIKQHDPSLIKAK